MYTTQVSATSKKCFFQNEKDGTCGIIRHKAAYIEIYYRGKPELCFKVTGKGKHYDSRDKGKKQETREFVVAELNRILGYPRGTTIYHEALVEMEIAM